MRLFWCSFAPVPESILYQHPRYHGHTYLNTIMLKLAEIGYHSFIHAPRSIDQPQHDKPINDSQQTREEKTQENDEWRERREDVRHDVYPSSN